MTVSYYRVFFELVLTKSVLVINIWKFNKVGEIGTDFSQAQPRPLSLKI